jgi:hypothetical protein
MRLNNSTILCDGELLGDTLIDSVIGLFDVSRFNETLARGGREFFPDRFFYGGTSHSPVSAHSLLETIRDDFVTRMAQNAPDWDRGEWDVCEFKFDLCPVTRALVKRAAAR